MRIKNRTNNGIVIPLIWWGIIGIVLLVHVILLGVFVIVSIILHKDPVPPPQPPIVDQEEVQAPARCDCGGLCNMEEP